MQFEKSSVKNTLKSLLYFKKKKKAQYLRKQILGSPQQDSIYHIKGGRKRDLESDVFSLILVVTLAT